MARPLATTNSSNGTVGSLWAKKTSLTAAVPPVRLLGRKSLVLLAHRVSGLVYAYTDILFDDSNPGEQFFVLTQTVPSTRLNHYGWASYIGSDGDVFLGNYGYLYACTPGLAPISNQRTYTAAQEALRNKTIHK